MANAENKTSKGPIKQIAEVAGLIGVGVALERYFTTGKLFYALGNPILLAAGGLFILDALI